MLKDKLLQGNASHKQAATDSLIQNLKRTDDESQNGDFIQNNDDTGSFQSIHTPICGIEVDVDEL